MYIVSTDNFISTNLDEALNHAKNLWIENNKQKEIEVIDSENNMICANYHKEFSDE